MQSTVYSLLFLASAPIALMPAAIALFTKTRRKTFIVPLNLLVWGGLYLLLRGSTLAPGALPSPGVIVLLIAWLVLLRFAILPKREMPE